MNTLENLLAVAETEGRLWCQRRGLHFERVGWLDDDMWVAFTAPAGHGRGYLTDYRGGFYHHRLPEATAVVYALMEEAPC